MIVLNCETLETCLNSLAAIYQITTNEIKAALTEVDFENLHYDSDPDYEIHRWPCDRFRTDPLKPQKVVWFHFTRTMDPNSFRIHGILPSNQSLPIVKNNLFKFAQCQWSQTEWDQVWEEAKNNLPLNDAIKLCTKNLFGNPTKPDLGPNGMLIKDIGLYPDHSSTGHFHKRPELIEGILRVIDEKYGTVLMPDFEREGKSCVVTFYTELTTELHYLTASALGYLNQCLRNVERWSTCWSYDAKNQAIDADHILSIELIDYDHQGMAVLTPIYQINSTE